MRTLVGFAVALALCIGIVGYFAVDAIRGVTHAPPALPAQPAEPAQVASAAPSERTTPAPQPEPLPNSASGAPPAEHSAAGAKPAATEVRWADEGSPAAERKLERARATLRHEPEHLLALRDEATALAELGRWREAETSLRKLVALRPDDLELRFDWAAALLRDRRHRDAADALRALVANNPNHDRAWFNLAVAHQSLGRLEEALDAWNHAIALRPTTAAYTQRGTLLLDLRSYAQAAADFEWVHAHEPLSIDTAHNLATAYRRLGRYDDAMRTLGAVLAYKPMHVPTINRIAETAWEAAERPQADAASLLRETIARCNQSLEIDPAQPDVAELKSTAEKKLAALAPPG